MELRDKIINKFYRKGSLYHLWHRKIMIPYLKKHCKMFGDGAGVGFNFSVSNPSNLLIGKDVAIGPNCVFYAANAEIKLGRGVMISPNVTIMTGEHRTNVIGEFMRYVSEEMKLPENDKPVVIEDDCWIGSNVTILKGTIIGRGSIIHAGCIVSGKVKPYTIYISDKLKVSRFTDEEIQEHERILKEKYGVEYPEYHPKDCAISRV